MDLKSTRAMISKRLLNVMLGCYEEEKESLNASMLDNNLCFEHVRGRRT